MSAVYYPEARIAIRAFFEDFGPTPGEGNSPATFHALPKSFLIQRTARHLPDSWSVEFDYESFPVDPDVLRAAAVEIWLWDKLSLTNKITFVDQPSTQLGKLRAAFDQAGAKTKPGPAIYGMVKEANCELTETGRVVRLEGEDYTSLFAKRRWHLPPGSKAKSYKDKKSTKVRGSDGKIRKRKLTHKVYRKVAMGDPILKIFQDMISDVDPFGVLVLRCDVKTIKASTVIKGLSRLQAKGMLADQEDTYWDVMTKVARLAGLSVYIEDTSVVLANAQTLYAESGVDPYVMRYGGPLANVKSLNMKRDMGKSIAPQVVVSSYDPKTRTTISEKYPEQAQQVVDGLGWKKDEQTIISVTGVTDKRVLQALARDKFERTCRGEREITVSTIDMLDAPASDTGPREPFDLTKIRAGEPCRVVFNPLGLDLSNMTSGQRTAVLTDRGFSSGVAQMIADAYGKKSDFNFPFYVKEAKLEWAAESGLTIEIQMMDYASPGGIRRA